MKYLVDTSALVRLTRRQVDGRWYDLADNGHIALCEPVLIETLTIADAKTYDHVERDLCDMYPWVPVPDDVWSMIGAVRREFAKHGVHNGFSVADYLVLATAMRLKLVVLHADADFEAAARYVPQLDQERI